MFAGILLDLKIQHFNVTFDKIGCKIDSLVMTDDQGVGMYVSTII